MIRRRRKINNLSRRDVIITGATSFIGIALVKKLLDQKNIRVFAIVRRESQNIGLLPKHPALHVLVANLEKETEKLVSILPYSGIFIHMGWAGLGSAGRKNSQIQKYNLECSLQALEIARRIHCKRFLFAGSQAEYGIHHDLITEETRCSPISEYGKAKLEFGERAERICRNSDMEYIHLRIFSIYGEGDHPWTLVQSCIHKFLCGLEIELGACTQRWNFLYIEDATEILLKIVQYEGVLKQYGYIYNIGGHDTRKLKEFIEDIYHLCGDKGKFSFGEEMSKPEGAVELIPDISKICNVFEWEPQFEFRMGIQAIINKERERLSI